MSDLFANLGGAFVSPNVTLPAALPLELSGESIRPRLCVFTDERGVEQALRPDLTLPVAIAEVEARRADARRGEVQLRYAAPAFRLPLVGGGQLEFVQAGFERLGAPSTAEVDTEVFAAVGDVVASAGVTQAHVALGDLAIFPAFVDALDLAPALASALKRAFRQNAGVAALLADEGDKKPGFGERLVGLSSEDAAAMVRETLAISGTELIGTRSLDEIVTRLVEQGEVAKAGAVPDAARALLATLTDFEASPEAAAEELAALAKAHKLSGLDGVIEPLAARHAAMAKATPDMMTAARFSVHFGRKFMYYDGFVFDMAETPAMMDRPFAGGGRYDTLLSRLSDGEIKATAIGGAARPDRLARAGGQGT